MTRTPTVARCEVERSCEACNICNLGTRMLATLLRAASIADMFQGSEAHS